MHEAFEKQHAEADTIVVFSHGFIGSPKQFEDLTAFAYQHNCAVLSPLLPGHGGSAAEFSKFGLEDWENHLEAEIRRVSSAYQNLILVGHSIGGLLALNASLNKELDIKAVLLLSSPLKLKYSLDQLLVGMQLALFPKRSDALLTAYRNFNSIAGTSLFRYLSWRRQALDVYRLMAKTKSNLPAVAVPTVMIHSKKDETVSLKSADIFQRGLANTERKSVILEESRHAFYVPKERNVICGELLGLIKRYTRS